MGRQQEHRRADTGYLLSKKIHEQNGENILKYLLDTNICIYLLNGNIALRNRVAKIGLYLIAISNSILAELYFGAYNSEKAAENLKRIELFKKDLRILSDSEESAMLFGKIKADLKSEGNMIEDFDILIASIAMANNCAVVTNNDKHFSRIENLEIENWLL